MKSLVKLQTMFGTTYVNPEDVRGIRSTPGTDGLSYSLIVYDPVTSAGEKVVGAPDEVHAQLFPESESAVLLDFSADSHKRSAVTIRRPSNVYQAQEEVYKSLLRQGTPWRAMLVVRDFGRAEGTSRITMESFLALCANAFVDVTFSE